MVDLKAAKSIQKDKELELHGVKSDCAATLIGKEKNSLQKIRDLEVSLEDMQFENQKYI